MNFSTMTLDELRGLLAQVEQTLNGQKQAALNEMTRLAEQVGRPLSEILQMPKPVPVKYRHPQNGALNWTGRGRAPLWVVEWERNHGSREGLLVA